MRRLIAGMKISLDAKMEGPDGTADWVAAWSEDYGLTSRIDACLLGGGMYPGYENYWTSIREQPTTPAWITGKPPTAAEIEWAAFVQRTPHYVLSNTLKAAQWPTTRFLRTLDDVAALKQQPGKDIYLIGGARTTMSALEAGLLDELRLIVHPLVAGPGKSLFASAESRRPMELLDVRQRAGGLVQLDYRVLAQPPSVGNAS
jgi:dihydrofolate reductase